MNNCDHGKSFNDIREGDMATFEVVVDELLHEKFKIISGDDSPVHTDDYFCARTKFQKKIGYAFLLTALLSRFYGKYIPGGSSICIRQEANFVKPFFIQDKIIVVGVVKRKIESTRFVEIETKMFRDCQELIFRGLGTVQILFE